MSETVESRGRPRSHVPQGRILLAKLRDNGSHRVVGEAAGWRAEQARGLGVHVVVVLEQDDVECRVTGDMSLRTLLAAD